MIIEKSPAPKSDRIVPSLRSPANEVKRLPSNPLDELDTLNHYGFKGTRDLTGNFKILTINDRSCGNESIFLAVQLTGTGAVVVHHDPCTEALEYVRKQAERFGVSSRIRLVGGTLESLGDECRFDPFDYVRYTGGSEDRDEFETLFERLLRFLKEDGVLGMTCFGYYGREPYRQMQCLAQILNGDKPGPDEELGRLKELFPFLPPGNMTRRCLDNLDPGIRVMKDEAFAFQFMRPDPYALKVPDLYRLLERYGLYRIEYSRTTRMLYEPWFATTDKPLYETVMSLPIPDREAVSEIAWGLTERHHFWAGRRRETRADIENPDNIPFFNPVSASRRNWKQVLTQASSHLVPELIVDITPEYRYTIPIPWGNVQRRLVDLIDGFKTLGEIVTLIREESDDPIGIDEIAGACFRFIDAVQREDMILLRHRDTPLLPFTARRLTAGQTGFSGDAVPGS